MGFEQKLLTELKRSVAESPRVIEVPRRRGAWSLRVTGVAVLAAAIAIGVGVLLPTSSGHRRINAAWAVTETDDGMVTVEISDIRNADGLERKLEEVGVPAAVHYLPQDKVCAPPGLAARLRGDSSKMARREAAMEAGPVVMGAVHVSESAEGAFVFTIDRSNLEPDFMVVVFAEHDVPEHGQDAESVASIAPLVFRGDYYEECRLVDGSIEGWGFQEGARPGQK
jgi:hypothetical protein